MANRIGPELLGDQELVSETRALVKRNNESEADIIEHLAEVDVRGLFRDYACSSLFDFCLRELGLSESVALNRITVARRSRQFPRMLVLLREGKTHVAGLRLLVPHLTEKNCEALLAEATRKSKRQVEEIVARLSPRPAVADAIRKLPVRQVEATRPEASVAAAAPQVPSTPPVSRAAEPAVGVSYPPDADVGLSGIGRIVRAWGPELGRRRTTRSRVGERGPYLRAPARRPSASPVGPGLASRVRHGNPGAAAPASAPPRPRPKVHRHSVLTAARGRADGLSDAAGRECNRRRRAQWTGRPARNLRLPACLPACLRSRLAA